MIERCTSPRAAALAELVQELRELAPSLDGDEAWPTQQLELCARAGVFEWFVGERWGGQQWSEADGIRGYLELGKACLTTAFIITQRTGACRRLEAAENDFVRSMYLPGLAAGARFATVAISHLTTSRRHWARPVLRAEESPDGFVLDGFSPWVTGAVHADVIVTGATLPDGRQILVALPADLPGLTVSPPARLVGLSASQTGPLHLEHANVEHRWLLAGPVERVMQQGAGANTGGLETSTLALGLARAALDYLHAEAGQRSDLETPQESLHAQWTELHNDLLRAAVGEPVCSHETLRSRANSLALRATQAALAAAKGSGYVVGHPAGRWSREALFFLVWSCPQPVMAANLCELAGIRG